MVRINNPSHIRQVLILGILGFLGLSVRPTCSLPLDGRRLLEGGFDGQLQLLHWSHPEAPHHIPGLSFTERLQLSVRNSRERAAALSSGMQLSAGAGAASVPAPGPSNLDSIAPVFNAGFEYAAEISIGTPPEKYSVVVDTGSDLVWVGCKGCDYCQSELPDPKYDPKTSSTYAKMSCADPFCVPVESSCPGNKTCDYEYDYGSAFTYGVMSYESFTLASTTGTTLTFTFKRFAFGCAYELFGDLGDVDGLMGLGQGPLSLTTQLGSFYGNKFSYCLVSAYDSNSSTSPLLFGDAAVPKAVPIQYTPIVHNPNASLLGSETYYYIGLKGINVNGVALDIPPGTFDIYPNGTGGTILDSGTTVTYLDTRAYSPLLAKMESLIKYTAIPFSNESIGFELCYNLTNVSKPTFPTVTFVLEGFSLELPPDNVFLTWGIDGTDSKSTVYCLSFGTLGLGLSIFGNLQQQNFQILFDRDAERFGFAEVQCDKL